MDDHDLLVRIDERLLSLQTHFTNHIRHHWLLTVPLIMTVVGLVIALLAK